VYLDGAKSPNFVLKFQPKDVFIGAVIAKFQNIDKDVQGEISMVDIASLNKELAELYDALANAKDDTAEEIVSKIEQKKHDILDAELNNYGVLPYSERVEKYCDAIFGDGSAAMISRYDGLTGELMAGIMEQVKLGYDYHIEESKKQEKTDRMKAIADARKEAAAFKAPQ